MASDTEEEAKYPPEEHLSVSSTTSSYGSLHRSTDSTDTTSVSTCLRFIPGETMVMLMLIYCSRKAKTAM
jgi:hypothetical protein